MTNEQLVARIQAGEDVGENMAALYEQTKAFIHSIAWRYRESGVDPEDLEQEGYLALYPAIDGYDPATGCKFLTYAEKWIRQRMQRYLQMNGKCLRLPVHCLEKVQRYNRLCSDYEREHGRRPSDALCARYLGLTLEQVEDIKKNAYQAMLVSLDSPIKGIDGGEDTVFGEFVPAPGSLEDDVLDEVQQEDLSSVLWACVDSLPENMPEVIRRRYQGGETLRQIGEAIGITVEAVRQQEGKALRELRKPSRAARLRPFLPEAERVYSMGLQGGGVDRFCQTWTSSTERAALRLMECIW